MKYFKKACAMAMVLTMATAVVAVPAEGATLYTSGALYQGKSGMDATQIKYLQYNLRGMDCYYGEIDGSFGPATVEAVKKYQRNHGLDVDGSAGPQTLSSIVAEVKGVQEKLKSLGYYTGDVDGVFGPGSTEAVKAFQGDYGLSVDGYVGPNTMSQLTSIGSGASNGANNAADAGSTGSGLVNGALALQPGRTIPNGTYKIFSELDHDMLVDVAGGSQETGANIQLYEDHSEAQQKFNVEYLGNGYYSIKAAHSNKSLDAAGAGMSVGTNVQQCKYTGHDAQQWVIQDAGNGCYYVVNKLNGLYMDAQNGESSNGTNIWLYNSNQTDSQKWRFIAVPAVESASSGVDSKIERFVQIAEAQVGTKEDSRGRVKYNEWYGMPGSPWCVMFAVWVANEAGIPIENGSVAREPISIKDTASSSACYKWCVANGRSSNTPEVGSLFFIKNKGSDRGQYPAEHTGIVVGISGNKLITVEGNVQNGKVAKNTFRNVTDSDILGYGKLY